MSRKVYRVKDSDYFVDLRLEEDFVTIMVTDGNEIIAKDNIPPIALISLAIDGDLKNQLTLKTLRKAVDIESHIESLIEESENG